MFRRIRSLALVLVLAQLFVTAAYARQSMDRLAPARPEVVAAAWQWFILRIAPSPSDVQPARQVVPGKAGSVQDPNGAGSLVTRPNTSARTSIEPYGKK